MRKARACTRCPELAATRKTVVFGAGNADADLMFVGEAPGANEDEQGIPFVGRAGKLLETLLEEIGLSRSEVFIANVLRCRPPGNRDPQPIEIANCEEYLRGQVELIEPSVICTLGNFSTKLLRDDPTGITRLHGQPEVMVLGRRAVRLYPIYHPAAALYTPRMLETLREDFVAAARAARHGGTRAADPRGAAGAARSSRRPPRRPPVVRASSRRRISWVCSRRRPAKKCPAKEVFLEKCRTILSRPSSQQQKLPMKVLSPSLQE